MELDHAVILCDPGAPGAAALREPGLREGSPVRQPVHGTACRRFFFANAISSCSGSDAARAGDLLHRVPPRPRLARELMASGSVSFGEAPAYTMTLDFRTAPDAVADLRPELPLVLRW